VGRIGSDGTRLAHPEGPRVDDRDSEIGVQDVVDSWSSSGSLTGAGKAGKTAGRV